MTNKELVRKEAIEVFGSEEKAHKWLATHHTLLDAKPIDYLESQEGFLIVMQILNPISNTKVTYVQNDSKEMLSLEPLVKQAVDEAVARQKALGLPNFYIRNGKIYGRASNGRFVSAK